jgi:2-phosphosulfolactate phosphatase
MGPLLGVFGERRLFREEAWDVSALNIDVALTPQEVRAAWKDKVCIVVDVLRASSTIVMLLAKGCRRVYTVSGVAAARRLARRQGFLLAGERGGVTLPGFDLGNSPSEVEALDVAGKEVVLTTTNGTRVVQRVARARAVLAGCFLNAKSCCERALALASQYRSSIGIVCAGERGRFVLDDALCAGFLVSTILQLGNFDGPVVISDAARATLQLFNSYPDIVSGFKDSSSGKRLMEIGRLDDLFYCSRVNVTDCVPILVENSWCWFEKL